MAITAYRPVCTSPMIQDDVNGNYIRRDDGISLASALIKLLEDKQHQIDDLEEALADARLSIRLQGEHE